ncbi:DUF5334 family protein [Desulfobacterales bacterium HSG17]|nr:DUF5334 family protein [Desulfobacterales bacterium HSG17]
MKNILFFFLVLALFFYFGLNDTQEEYPEGYTDENVAFIEIGKENLTRVTRGALIRVGETIEAYDHNDGKYKKVVVESIKHHEYYDIVEIFDLSTCEIKFLEMNY